MRDLISVMEIVVMAVIATTLLPDFHCSFCIFTAVSMDQWSVLINQIRE